MLCVLSMHKKVLLQSSEFLYPILIVNGKDVHNFHPCIEWNRVIWEMFELKAISSGVTENSISSDVDTRLVFWSLK